MDLSIYLNKLDKGIVSKEHWDKNTIGETVTQYSEDVNLFDFDIS